MRKGVDKRKAEDDEVLGRCIRLISTCYLNKPYPILSQFSDRRDLDELILASRKEGVELGTYELQELIYRQGCKLKSLVEDDLLDYYLL